MVREEVAKYAEQEARCGRMGKSEMEDIMRYKIEESSDKVQVGSEWDSEDD